MSHLPKIPLHLQNSEVSKAYKPKNPSYESFRPNIMHESSGTRSMDGSANEGMSVAYRVRRYPNGDLDHQWLANQIIDAMHKLHFNGDVLPIEMALLTVLFPVKFRLMDPQLAEIRTQLSSSEKDVLRALIEKQLVDEANWSAGIGGGNTTPNNVGKP